MIKGRLKNTASFCVLISVYGSVVVCAPAVRSVGCGSVVCWLPLCRIGSEENDCDVCYWCDDVGQTVNMAQTVTRKILYCNMMLSVMICE